MKCAGALFAVLFGLVAASRSSHGTKSPVEKVVNLLKDLKNKAEQDGENEQKIYDKYACFCDNALKGKADAIDKARADMRSLGQEILKKRGRVATLTKEIAKLAGKIKKNLELQEEATEMRAKENGEFVASTDEMKQVLTALEQAITVLKTANKRSLLLQTSTSTQASAIKNVLQKLPSMTVLKAEQLSLLQEVLKSGYAPQSESIQGILGNMYDTFANDLQDSMQQEAKSNRDFEEFIETKQEELGEMSKIKSKKEAAKADAEQALAEASELYDETEEQMEADIDYFDVTKKGCLAKSEEWTKRSDLRKMELAGIEKAIEILTSDEARELFNKSIKAGKETGVDESKDAGVFLQLDSDSSTTAPNMRAYALLKAKATGAHSLRLAQLAVHVHNAKVGHFDKVIAAIDEMIKALNEEDAADIKKRDQCKDELQKIESKTKDLEWKIKNNVATIDKLTSLIAKREAEKQETIEAIKEVEEQMKQMTKERKAENKDFKQKKKEDQDSIKLLKAAMKALEKYYKDNDLDMGEIQGSVKGMSLRQDPEFEVSKYQAPEAEFSDGGSRKDMSKGIVSLMTYIIEDQTDEIKNAMSAEEKAQLQYEDAMSAAKKLKMDLFEKKMKLTLAIAKRQKERADEKEDKKGNEGELKDELDYKASIKPDCDWILGAFEKRAKARAMELEGLTGAKEYLAGATLLQTPRAHFLAAHR